MDYYMYLFPGKIRIRTSLLKILQSNMTSAKTSLKSLKGVTSISVDSSAGSILINFDRSKISSQKIIDVLAKNGYMPQFNLRKKANLQTINS